MHAEKKKTVLTIFHGDHIGNEEPKNKKIKIMSRGAGLYIYFTDTE